MAAKDQAKAQAPADTAAKAASEAKGAVEAAPAAKKRVAGRKPSTAKPVAAKPVPAVKAEVPAKPAVKKVVPAKPVAAKPVKQVAATSEKPVSTGASVKAAPTEAAAKKTAPIDTPAFAGLFTQFMPEDTMMDMSANFASFQDAMTEAQSKAKAAFEKSTAMMGEAGDFAKGNVEAAMESGKILADGVQSMGSELVTEGRSAFETMSSDIKELAAAKSPTDFFKLQGDMVRKNFDSAVAYSSKNSEAMLKLMSDVMAPLSGRMSLAMEKVRSVSM